MFLLRPLAAAAGLDGAEEEEDARPSSGSTCARQEEEEEALTEEQELELKNEALRMAEYREAMRAACARTQAAEQTAEGRLERTRSDATDSTLSDDAEDVPKQPSPPMEHRPASMGAVQFDMEHDNPPVQVVELDDMYDFSMVVPSQATRSSSSSTLPERHTQADEAEQRRVRMVEATLHEREQALETQMKMQDKKLATASRALHKTKSQVQQLNAQVSLKDLAGKKLESQVSQLRQLLVEKERRLQDALDGHEAAAAAAAAKAGAADQQQPQEPLEAAAAAVVDEGQITELVHITEELTGALEQAQRSEDDARNMLASTAARLEQEQRERQHFEADFAAARAKQEAEVEVLRSQIANQEQAMAESSRRAKETEERTARVDVEERLRQALAKKKNRRGDGKWHPHLEV